MKNLFLPFLLLFFSGYLTAQSGTKLNIKVVNTQGKPIPNVIFTAPDVQQLELISDRQGLVSLLTPYDVIDVYATFPLILHANTWTISLLSEKPELHPDLQTNTLLVTLEGRKKGVIVVVLEPKAVVLPVRTAELTDEKPFKYGVQVACITTLNPEIGRAHV